MSKIEELMSEYVRLTKESAQAREAIEVALADLADGEVVHTEKGVITKRGASTQVVFDSAKFKVEQPALYNAYMKEREVKGCIAITINKEFK